MVVMDIHLYFGGELVEFVLIILFMVCVVGIFGEYPLFCTRMKFNFYVSYQIYP